MCYLTGVSAAASSQRHPARSQTRAGPEGRHPPRCRSACARRRPPATPSPAARQVARWRRIKGEPARRSGGQAAVTSSRSTLDPQQRRRWRSGGGPVTGEPLRRRGGRTPPRQHKRKGFPERCCGQAVRTTRGSPSRSARRYARRARRGSQTGTRRRSRRPLRVTSTARLRTPRHRGGAECRVPRARPLPARRR